MSMWDLFEVDLTAIPGVGVETTLVPCDDSTGYICYQAFDLLQPLNVTEHCAHHANCGECDCNARV